MDEYSSVYQIPVFQYVYIFSKTYRFVDISNFHTRLKYLMILSCSTEATSILLKVTIIHFLPPPLPSIFDVYQVQASSTDLQVVGSKPG